MSGIAAGAGVDLEDIVMLNARYDLAHIKGSLPAPKEANGSSQNGKHDPEAPSECTSAIILSEATCDGSVVSAQNWDMSHHLYDEDAVIYLEVHPSPSENIPSMFIVTEAGQLCRSGMNSAGLGLTANSLQSSIDRSPIADSGISNGDENASLPAIPPSGTLRRIFLEQSNYADGLKRISVIPRHVSFNLMVSTAENYGLCLEVTPQTIYRIPVSSASPDSYVLHSNHFKTLPFLCQSQISDLYTGGSSWYRAERLEVGIRPKASRGALTEDDIIKAFQDHMGYPHSLCEHAVTASSSSKKPLNGYRNPYPGPTCTVSCVIYNLSKKTVKVCKGPPCEGIFQEFVLKEN